MVDEYVATCLRRFTWRILSNFVSPWELEQIKGEIETWDQWCPVWVRWAEDHVSRGDRAAEQGNARTAGDAYVRAGLFYHWGSFQFSQDKAQMLAALEGAQASFAKAAPLVDPPMEMLSIPFEGASLRGYLRKPVSDPPPPLAILIPGADSTKEELYDHADHLVARGVAILAIDGPGHGLVSFDLPLRPDYEVAVSAVIDHLVATRTDLDLERLVVGGISYGGLFACRAAAFDDRVTAAFSVSSWYTPAGRWDHMDELSQHGLRHYMGDNAKEVQSSITMEGAAEHITVPLLQVYGGQDPASPPEHAYRVEREVQGPATTVVFDEGVHVCNNIAFKARPLVGDWVAEQVAGRA